MHLEENLDDWLTEELDNYLDDDYLVFDCPGTHNYSRHFPIYVQETSVILILIVIECPIWNKKEFRYALLKMF